MNIYTISDDDFNRCIGSWLNVANPNYQTYVKGIKLFHEYLDDLKDTTPVITTATTDPEDTQAGGQNVSKAKGELDNDLK